MDMQTSDMEVFIRSLTDEEIAVCESDEESIGKILCAGLSERTAVEFHRAMLRARRFTEGATTEGVLEAALVAGFSFVENLEGGGDMPGKLMGGKKSSKRGVRVVGVPGNRRGRTGVPIREA